MRESASTDPWEPQGSNPLGRPGLFPSQTVNINDVPFSLPIALGCCRAAGRVISAGILRREPHE